VVPRVRRKPELRRILKAAEDEPLDPDLDDPALHKDPMAVEERREIFEVLARARATDEAGLREALGKAVRRDGKFVPPLVVVEGALSLPFDEVEALRAAVAATLPLSAGDDRLKAAIADAEAFLSRSDAPVAPAVPEALSLRIREAFAQTKRAVTPAELDAQIERALLSKRCYQRRDLLGGTQLRALLVPSGAEESVPAYLPEAVQKELPLCARFRARMVAELYFAVDQYEAHPGALEVLALGWVMPTRKA